MLQRFPIGDGREIVLSRGLLGPIDVRVDAQPIGSATRAQLRKGVLFEDPDGAKVQVVAIDGVPGFPMFDVYHAGKLLPHSVGDPARARRTVIELLLLLSIYSLGGITGAIRELRVPSGWFEWGHLGFAMAGVALALAALARARFVPEAARVYAFLRCAVAFIQVEPKGFGFNVDLVAVGLYVWMRHATEGLEAIDSPPEGKFIGDRVARPVIETSAQG